METCCGYPLSQPFYPARPGDFKLKNVYSIAGAVKKLNDAPGHSGSREIYPNQMHRCTWYRYLAMIIDIDETTLSVWARTQA